MKHQRDELPNTLIDPEFYTILKDEGWPTARRADGSYFDKSSERFWQKFLSDKLAKRDAQIVATRKAIEKYKSNLLEGTHQPASMWAKAQAFETLLSDLERILEEK